jgi:hypothetical protein
MNGVVMNASLQHPSPQHHFRDSLSIIPMPKSSYPQPEDALPKIHLALEEMPERVASRRVKVPPIMHAHTPHEHAQHHPALMYAGAILGESQPANRADSAETSAAPYLRMLLFVGAVMALLWLGVAAVLIPERAQEAELSFDPARVSEEFERSLVREVRTRDVRPPSPASITGAKEQNPALDTIPRRRVMVVTEGDKEQLLDTLKSQGASTKDDGAIETYILNPSHPAKE